MGSLFLFFAFFFPRATLLLTWLFGTIPANDTPFVVDVIGAIFAPRLLVAWWAYCLNLHPLLIILFVIGGVFELFGGGGSATRRKKD